MFSNSQTRPLHANEGNQTRACQHVFDYPRVAPSTTVARARERGREREREREREALPGESIRACHSRCSSGPRVRGRRKRPRWMLPGGMCRSSRERRGSWDRSRCARTSRPREQWGSRSTQWGPRPKPPTGHGAQGTRQSFRPRGCGSASPSGQWRRAPWGWGRACARAPRPRSCAAGRPPTAQAQP